MRILIESEKGCPFEAMTSNVRPALTKRGQLRESLGVWVTAHVQRPCRETSKEMGVPGTERPRQVGQKPC